MMMVPVVTAHDQATFLLRLRCPVHLLLISLLFRWSCVCQLRHRRSVHRGTCCLVVKYRRLFNLSFLL